MFKHFLLLRQQCFIYVWRSKTVRRCKDRNEQRSELKNLECRETSSIELEVLMTDLAGPSWLVPSGIDFSNDNWAGAHTNAHIYGQGTRRELAGTHECDNRMFSSTFAQRDIEKNPRIILTEKHIHTRTIAFELVWKWLLVPHATHVLSHVCCSTCTHSTKHAALVFTRVEKSWIFRCVDARGN